MRRILPFCWLALSLLSCASLQARDAKDKSAHTEQPAQNAAPPASSTGTAGNMAGPAGTAQSNQHQDEPRWLGFPMGSWADFAMVLITAGGVLYARRTLKQIGEQTRAANANAAAALASANAVKFGERAYVNIRHQATEDQWDGFYMGFYPKVRDEEGLFPCTLDVKIVNSGGTPARVHGGQVVAIRDLPNHPYVPPPSASAARGRRGYVNGFFLHAGQWYRQKLKFAITNDERLAMTEDNGQLWLVGFVDYSDQFDVRYRSRFCRRARLRRDGNDDKSKSNLSVDPTCEDYNDDYEIDQQGNRKQTLMPSNREPRRRWWQRLL